MSRIAIPKKLASLLKNQLSGNDITKVEADKCGLLAREILKHANRKDLYKNFVNMGTDKLIGLLGKRSYKNVVDHLINSKVIIRTESYYAGNGADMGVDTFPKAITLLDDYNKQDQCEFWNVSTQHSIEAIAKTYKTKTKSKIAADLAEIMQEFDVDTTGCNGKEKFMRCKWTLENINSVNERKFFMTEDNFSGRLHTNFTQMNSAARKQIFTIEGKRSVKSLDVSSMAPLAIGWLVREGAGNSFLELDCSEEEEEGGEAQLVIGNRLSSLNRMIPPHVITSYSSPPNPHIAALSTMFLHLQCNELLLNQKKTPCFIDSNSDLAIEKLEKSAQKKASWSIPILNNTNKRVKGWIDDCQSGDLYPRIRSLIPTTHQRFEYCDMATRNRFTVDLSKLSAKAFKKQVLTVIYDRNEQSIKNPVWKTIQRQYPEIADFIYQIKAGDRHREMSRLTQSLERKIMVDGIARAHFEQGLPIVTVHDEIITATPNDTRRIMKSKFAEMGLTPTIK